MRLFLIRHGETVDNVANLYAGSRDSELTNHGVQQATRLGHHFTAAGIRISHLFSSQLKRAVKTADCIRKAQLEKYGKDEVTIELPHTQIQELAEQDFGSYEGVSFLARQPGSKFSGKEAHRAIHKDDPGFVDMESRESMIRRVDIFLDKYLEPLVRVSFSQPMCIALVSHAITLSVLWRRLLHRMPPRSVNVGAEVLARYSGIDLERIGGWSNTGYLELDIVYDRPPVSSTPPVLDRSPSISKKEDMSGTPAVADGTIEQKPAGAMTPEPKELETSAASPHTAKAPAVIFEGWRITVNSVNSRSHLQGLKRTGGGVGSARHDEKQQGIEGFFKKRKLG